MSTPSQKPRPPDRHRMSNVIQDYLSQIPHDHPLRIAFRTYALALSFSLAPPLTTTVLRALQTRQGSRQRILHVLKRELGYGGFAFAITVGIAGGATIKKFWDGLKHSNEAANNQASTQSPFSTCGSISRTFIAYALSGYCAIRLLQSHTRPAGTKVARGNASTTLDLTLLLLVRACDALFRANSLPSTHPLDASYPLTTAEIVERQERRRRYTRTADALVFWASSARIMWCFFYEPHRLPGSYNKWIMSLAKLDPRILTALRLIRSKEWKYTHQLLTHPNLTSSLATDLGYPAEWGDVSRIPAVGGPAADALWESLGVSSRKSLGGLPCELVHCGVGDSSCTENVVRRGTYAFTKALLIYLPVHILPTLLLRPHKLLSLSHLFHKSLSILRSASFLSTFVSSIWMTVCLTRTLLLPRLFPAISHDIWDGPYGCAFAGSLVCGSSIWLEHGRRRGEMALYVLPKALRSCLPESLITSGRCRSVERLSFVISLATLLTMWSHNSESLRGLSKGTLAFVMNGSRAGPKRSKSAQVSSSETRPRSFDSTDKAG